MKQHNAHCTDHDLQVLLQSEESDTADSPVIRHLETCSDCQTRLDHIAGSEADWRESREALLVSPEALPGSVVSTAPPTAWSPPSAVTDAVARQLLAAPSHSEMMGRIGRFDVEYVIGSGGMGIVFKAFDTELNRPVAIKVLAPHLAGHGAARKRFEREARAAAAVVHEHVVPIHNVESDAASPFLVMQWVQGESLQQRLDREGPLTLPELLRIATQIASGLSAAHAQGLIHRDVKPSNVLLEQGVERALLTDFGLARASDDATLTHSGCHPGTPQYMSPEQARGDTLDFRSDLFSLGSVMYSMCAGHPPFRADTSYGILRKITDTEPRVLGEINPDIPLWLQNFVQTLLSKHPDNRPVSALQAAETLQRCLAHVQQPTQVPVPAELTRRTAGKTRWWSRGIKLTVGLTLVAGVTFGVFQITRTSDGTKQTSQPNGVVKLEASTDAPAAGSPAAWDQTSEEIHALSDDLSSYEARATALWGERPVQ